MMIKIRRWVTQILFLLLLSSALLLQGAVLHPIGTQSLALDLPFGRAQQSADTWAGYARLNGEAKVVMTVNGAPLTITLDGNNAPITAGNFVDLVQRGFYDGLIFHRVIREPQPFVAQGGDPDGVGTGGFFDPATNRQRYIPLEIKSSGNDQPNYSKAFGRQTGNPDPVVVLPHRRGAIAMARSRAADSASSQFYFALSDIGFLDGDYAVFGYVTDGLEVLDGIQQGDRIESVTVIEGLENLT